jgi:hypothetical protein
MYYENINDFSTPVINFLKKAGPDTYFFWPMASNGDKAVFLSFLNQMADYLKVDVRVVQRASEPQPVVELFPLLHDRRLIVPDEVVSNFFSQITLHMSSFLLNCERPTPGMPFFTWVASYGDGTIDRLWRRSGQRELSHVNLVRHILGIPQTAAAEKIDLGALPSAPDLVFFAPMANFFKVDYKAFLPMASKCRKAGFRLVWNFTEVEYAKLDSEFKRHIASDALFSGSLFEALRLAKMSRIVVSARSGFCELLSLCDCRYGTVYSPDCVGPERVYWNLDSLGSRPSFEVDFENAGTFQIESFL